MSDDSKILSGDSLFNEVMESVQEEVDLYKKIKIDGDHVVLNIQYEYAVPVVELQSYDQIISWVLHLSEKTWVEKVHLVAFIRVACKAAGLKEPRY